MPLIAQPAGPRRALTVVALAGSLALGAADGAEAQVSVAPDCNPATISGTVRDGESLTARRGSCSGVPAPTVTLQWFFCDAQLQMCVNRTRQIRTSSLAYVVTPEDVNGRLVAQQVATNQFGSDLDNTITAVVAAIRPSATPVISGVAQVGEQLTGSEGFVSGTSASVTATQWLRCEADGRACTAIPGATTRRYVLTQDDAAKTVRFQVVVSGPQHNVEVLSAPTPPVQPAPPVGQEPSPPPGPETPGRKAPARLRILRPFPSVLIVGRAFDLRAVVSTLLVRGPNGARVTVTCRGPDCPVRRQRRTIRRGSLRLRRFETGLIAGTVIEIRVTSADRIGKFTRLRIVRERAPSRTDLCLKPGRRRPIGCPKGAG